MAEHVFTNAHVSLGGVDLSDHVRQVTLRYSGEPQDITAMSATARARLGGLLDWSLDVEFNQDYAAGEVDATLFSLVSTSVAVVLRPDAGVIGPTNPEFTGNAILENYQPLGGTVGDPHVSPVTFVGNGALARATA